MNQTSQGVPIHIAHTFSGFQLLELPPELLSIVENGTATKLYLKSENEATESAQSRNDSLAMVCSEDKTFEVRQAQSSNSIYVLQADPTSQGGSHMTAVALCKAALELVPARPKAVQHLAKNVPTFHGPDATATTTAQAGETVSKAALQADAPFSSAEFETAWRELCAFELEGAAWQPSHEVKLGVWNSLASAAAVSGVKLTQAFDVASLQDLVQEDGYGPEILMAILRGLTTNGSVNDKVQLDRARCVAWLGVVALIKAGAKGITEDKLREHWQELLPDAWEKDAKLENIAGKYKLIDSLLYPVDETDSGHAAGTKASEQARPKNKWHSKFAA